MLNIKLTEINQLPRGQGSQGQPGAARGSQGQPRAARGSQGQPGAARGKFFKREK